MRTKSGLPKRKALRTMPQFEHGFKDNPFTSEYRHPQISGLLTDREKSKNISVISMFAGCGGFDLGLLGGFQYSGELYPPLPFRIIRAYEIDPKATSTYSLNISSDVQTTDLTEIKMQDLPYADVLAGGFPCQDFSSSGTKLGLSGNRGQLYKVMIEYMLKHKPKVVLAENVPHLAKMKSGSVLRKILSEFEEVGYDFKVWNLFCPEYGLSQNRSRIFLVGVRKDLIGEPLIPKPLYKIRYRPIEWAIGDLENVFDESIPNQSQYFVATKATAGAGQGDEQNTRGKISYCIRANPKARVHFHYELDRRLTVRECARLQSFPDEFVFPHSAGTNVMQIGNAVPPIIGYHVGKSIANFFTQLQLNWPMEIQDRNIRQIQLSFLAEE